MLILERKRDEKVVIDGPCVVTVTRLNDGRVWLGFEADQSVRILRGELRQKREGKP